jgi:hypothetical protein
MRCLMCERMYSEEYGDTTEGFCSESCRHVYEHLYGAGDLMAGQAVKLKA